MSVHPFSRPPSRLDNRGGPCAHRQQQALSHTEWVAASAELLDDLEDMLEERQVLALVDFAAKSVSELGPGVGDYLSALRRSGLYEAAVLATAMEWLASGARPDSVMDPDAPKWLVGLDQGLVTGASVCQDTAKTTSYVVGLQLPGGHTGAFQARIDHTRDDTLSNYFVTDDSPGQLARLLTGVPRTPVGDYQPTGAELAVAALAAGVRRYDAGHFDREPANPWPGNRMFLEFVLAKFEVGEEPQN